MQIDSWQTETSQLCIGFSAAKLFSISFVSFLAFARAAIPCCSSACAAMTSFALIALNFSVSCNQLFASSIKASALECFLLIACFFLFLEL